MRRPRGPATRSCSRPRCWTRWPVDATPNSNAASAWWVRIATISNCGSATRLRKALPAMGNRGRWRWRCGWRRMSCCAQTAATRCCCSTMYSPNSTRRRRQALANVAASAEQVLVTAAVNDDMPADWDARRIEITMHDEDTGRISEVKTSDAISTTTTAQPARPSIWRAWPAWIWCAAPWKKHAARPAAKAKTSAGAGAPRPPTGRRKQPSALVGPGPGSAGPEAARRRDTRRRA